jgi:hypothetical protein
MVSKIFDYPSQFNVFQFKYKNLVIEIWRVQFLRFVQNRYNANNSFINEITIGNYSLQVFSFIPQIEWKQIAVFRKAPLCLIIKVKWNGNIALETAFPKTCSRPTANFGTFIKTRTRTTRTQPKRIMEEKFYVNRINLNSTISGEKHILNSENCCMLEPGETHALKNFAHKFQNSI